MKYNLRARPLSWTAISSFEYDKDQWFNKYVLGKPTPITPELEFGKKFADAIEAGKPMAPVTILSQVEQPFEVVFGDLSLVGYADTFDKDTKKHIGEFKTGKTKNPWTQKRVDEHGQITMYCLMNLITNKVKPEDTKLFLEWCPTQENGDYTISLIDPNDVRHFDTKRTMLDIVNFMQRIKNVTQEMESYAQFKLASQK